MKAHWYASKHTAFRIWLALSWIFTMHYRYFRVRRQLRDALGEEWAVRHLRSVGSLGFRKASRDLLATAIQPAHRSEVSQRTRRFRQILSSLKTLNRPQYSISTAAGNRVFRVALARCLRSICQQQVSPEMLEMVDARSGLVGSLVQWLENSGVQSDEATSGIPANLGWHDIASGQAMSTQTKELDRQFRDEQLAASFRIAENEVRSAIAEQEFQFLALPCAILRAHRQLDPTHTLKRLA